MTITQRLSQSTTQQSSYRIEGEFLGFLAYKYIQVRVGECIIPIKLAKELRETIGQELETGDRISVFLEQKGSGLGSLKLKSDRVEKLEGELKSSITESPSTKKNLTGKVLVCRKSSCAKRGGKQLYRALVDTLQQLGLQERVTIQLTDCQKQCKQAPSLILIPGRVKHAYVHPNNLKNLLKAHYL